PEARSRLLPLRSLRAGPGRPPLVGGVRAQPPGEEDGTAPDRPRGGVLSAAGREAGAARGAAVSTPSAGATEPRSARGSRRPTPGSWHSRACAAGGAGRRGTPRPAAAAAGWLGPWGRRDRA